MPDISSSIVGVGVGVKFSIPPSGMTSSCPGESTLGLSSSLAIMMSASGTLYKFESPPSDSPVVTTCNTGIGIGVGLGVAVKPISTSHG